MAIRTTSLTFCLISFCGGSLVGGLRGQTVNRQLVERLNYNPTIPSILLREVLQLQPVAGPRRLALTKIDLRLETEQCRLATTNCRGTQQPNPETMQPPRARWHEIVGVSVRANNRVQLHACSVNCAA